MKKMRSRGLTLIELIVVVAILAVLAMIIIPKLDGLTNVANHAAASASVNDTGRYLQTFQASKRRFPDGWDSLTDGTSIWQANNPATKTKGLHTAFHSGGKFTQTTLTQSELKALNGLGVYTLYDVTSSLLTSKRPGDVFTTTRSINVDTGATTAVAVIVNPSTPEGINIINRVYRENGKNGTNGQFYDAAGVAQANRKLVALGLGPQNELIGKLAMEAPSYANVDATLVYNRNIVLFEVGGSKGVFKGVVAADGDLLDDLTTYINRDM
ncbi:MAG: prepilin-type N-terminal cleavage/methylation domain-containing protein [Planctomycetales bacterium]|nr:prepilin-type N-terminal cleavage/methylation domain-containing protein [Planctomycetales bacterium]MBN8625697.1 prepilin-type N-terminal cleavage/methylation domain-containing protein [Planctomycetota bacterium]